MFLGPLLAITRRIGSRPLPWGKKPLTHCNGRNLREQALEQYVSAFLNEEQPEMFWTKTAGIEAGRLAYEMREWQKAIKIYQQLQKMLPASLPFIQNRIQD